MQHIYAENFSGTKMSYFVILNSPNFGAIAFKYILKKLNANFLVISEAVLKET
jgi:hypothetical protein